MSSQASVLSILLFLFSLFACKKDGPCGEYHCLNGGVCVDNECYCPSGYSGDFCELESIPGNMQITKIKVTRFPPTVTSGSNANQDPKPDIYVVLYYNNAVIYTHPTNYSEAEPNSHYDFSPAGNIVLSDPAGTYHLALYDKDEDPDDLVAEQSFTPYIPGLGFPDVVKFDNPGDLSFELTVSYAF